MSSRLWDAIVVGGGPAGSALAARLADLGHGVLLLDRDEFPRPKACGECVSPGGVRALDRLGVLDEVERHAPRALLGWTIQPLGGASFHGRFPAGEAGLAIRREVLDHVLLRNAERRGVTVRTGAQVTDLVCRDGRVSGVEIRNGNAKGTRTERARLVIGADGLRSVVVRRLELIRRAPRLRKLALTAHVRGLGDLGGRGELHVLLDGVVGVAAVDDGSANVTVVLSRGRLHSVGGDRDETFDAVLRELPRFAAARRLDDVLATGPFDWPTRSAVADGALLVGDAAGYFDPFTGQGIYRALRGAEMAAPVTHAALNAGDVSARGLEPYDRARREFLPTRALQHIIEQFVSRPRALDAVAPVFRRIPWLADRMVEAVGDVGRS